MARNAPVLDWVSWLCNEMQYVLGKCRFTPYVLTPTVLAFKQIHQKLRFVSQYFSGNGIWWTRLHYWKKCMCCRMLWTLAKTPCTQYKLLSVRFVTSSEHRWSTRLRQTGNDSKPNRRIAVVATGYFTSCNHRVDGFRLLCSNWKWTLTANRMWISMTCGFVISCKQRAWHEVVFYKGRQIAEKNFRTCGCSTSRIPSFTLCKKVNKCDIQRYCIYLKFIWITCRALSWDVYRGENQSPLTITEVTTDRARHHLSQL